MGKGPFDPERVSYSSNVYAIYQPTDGTQLTIAKNLLSTPHGQYFGNMDSFPIELRSKVKEIFPQSTPFPSDHSAFEFIESRIVSDTQVFIPWEQCYNFVLENAANEKSSGGLTQQRLFVNAGFASGHSFCRKSEHNGIPSPSPLVASKDPFISELMATVTLMLDKLVPGLWGRMTKECLDKFARTIHKKNKLKFLRIAVTDVATEGNGKPSNQCNIHDNSKNDPILSEVAIFSTVLCIPGLPITRMAIICCMRKSVSDTMERFNLFGPSLVDLLSCYVAVDNSRRYLSDMGPSVDWDSEGTINTNGMTYVKRPCHMKTSAYTSNLIHLILCMKTKIGLDYIEVLQLIILHGYTPFTVYYLCSVLFKLLQQKELKERVTAFGEMVGHMMLELVDTIKANTSRKIPGSRYAKYRETNVATPEHVKNKGNLV